jgi:hypothetical protein
MDETEVKFVVQKLAVKVYTGTFVPVIIFLRSFL